VRFIPNEEVLRLYEEETRRNSRQDTRYEEEIAKNERTIEISANINIVLNNSGELAVASSNNAPVILIGIQMLFLNIHKYF
jgi:hypothetical protein